MKIALAQINTTIGDFAGNEAKILAAYERGVEGGVGMVVVPELATTGYPPRDLLLKSEFIKANLDLVNRLANATCETGLLVGYVGENSVRPGREVTNAVALLQSGRLLASRTKTLLPTYDVFDEDRYFEPADGNQPVEFNGGKIGLTICEDVWNDEDFWRDRRYRRNPVVELVELGAKVIFNVSASPWHLGKNQTRAAMLQSLAHKTGAPLIYCNLVGGNDELIFDGASLAFNSGGQLIARGRLFAEDFVVIDTDSSAVVSGDGSSEEEQLFNALVLGLRDYLHKCGFTSAVLGLSGGIDSALVACLAVAALGAGNVRGVSLPSQFSSRGSLDDARELAGNLGIRYDVVPIQSAFESVKKQLVDVFMGKPEDTTEENIQARLRAVILMALSNKFGSLWINRDKEIIPAASITKPPSAELRPDQTDQDTLPPYDVLDAILEAYVVRGESTSQIIGAGFKEEVVKRVVRLIDGAEYKRRQAAPGLKVTSKAFGVGRRIPIAQRYWER